MSMDANHSRTVSSDWDGIASILKTSFVRSCKARHTGQDAACAQIAKHEGFCWLCCTTELLKGVAAHTLCCLRVKAVTRLVVSLFHRPSCNTWVHRHCRDPQTDTSHHASQCPEVDHYGADLEDNDHVKVAQVEANTLKIDNGNRGHGYDCGGDLDQLHQAVDSGHHKGCAAVRHPMEAQLSEWNLKLQIQITASRVKLHEHVRLTWTLSQVWAMHCS